MEPTRPLDPLGTRVASDGPPSTQAAGPPAPPNEAPTERLPPRAGMPDQMGVYRLGTRLGGGGMGVVFNAVDENLNREAAVKVIHPEIASNAEHFARLKREAQSSAMLSHRHIVSVYAFGVERGFPYIAMEKLAGHDLEQVVIRGGPVRPERAVRYMREAAEALGFAAASGIIHRDIKPSNLFLTDRGEIKVMDFGLARQAGSETNLTLTGMVMGTPGYMAPEQARGQSDLDARADIFSLGCTLYALLKGERPMSDKTPMEAMINMATQPIELPKEWRSLAGGRIYRILERMTATDRNARFADWEEVTAALADAELVLLGGTGSGPVRTGAPGGSSAMWKIAAVAAVVAVIVALGVFIAPRFMSAPPSSGSGASRGTSSGTSVASASGAVPENDSASDSSRADDRAEVPRNAVNPERRDPETVATIEVAGAEPSVWDESPRERPAPVGTGRGLPIPPPPPPPFAPPGGDPASVISEYLGAGLMELHANATALQQALWVGDWDAAERILASVPPAQQTQSRGHGEEAQDVRAALGFARAFEVKFSIQFPATDRYRSDRAEAAARVLENATADTPFEEALTAAIYLALLGVPDLHKLDDHLARLYPRGRQYDDGIRRVHSIQGFVYGLDAWYPGFEPPSHGRGGGPGGGRQGGGPQGGGGRPFGGPPGGPGSQFPGPR